MATRKKVLLDTNIIIHRENKSLSSYSIGHLYRWIDKLGYEKFIHPLSKDEISNYQDEEYLRLLSIKLKSYEELVSQYEPTDNFLDAIGSKKKENDYIDDILLYNVYKNTADILITEDKGLLKKSKKIDLQDRVFSIDEFLIRCTELHPELIEYSALSVKKEYFGNIDLEDPFFDTLKEDYSGFETWFNRKSNEEAYICKSDEELLGFLYLKIEDESENYQNITPKFESAKRLKIGTFKVESTGFRLGERFLKIVFDNAIEQNVDEIYVTLFDERNELLTLKQLLYDWGFNFYGYKDSDEMVLVKKLGLIDENKSIKQNFPNINLECNKYIMPIFSKYHTSLFPDSRLTTEKSEDFLDQLGHRYALQKIYISTASRTNNAKRGDLMLIYRTGATQGRKKYESVITSLVQIEDIITNIESSDQLLEICSNRSVFTDQELLDLWSKRGSSLILIKMIFVKSLNKRPILKFLWEENIVEAPSGPRPFTFISNEQFCNILAESETNIEKIGVLK